MKMSYSRKKSTATGDDEVEQLLQAAQDDVLLKLNTNSHMARAASAAAIDPDLERRFQALRKPNPPSLTPNSKAKAEPEVDSSTKTGPTGNTKKIVNDDDGDDLFARFAALKNSLPSSHSSNQNSSTDGNCCTNQQPIAEEDDGEDEVEKVIKWAIDAARLDPSTPSDDDGDAVSDDDEEDREKNKNKKG